MPKYIKKEMADLNGKGSPQAYYKLEAWRKLEFDEFVERCHKLNGSFSKAVITGVVTAVCDQLAMELANGFTVNIKGLGTFGCKLGVRTGKEMDGFDEDDSKLNARSIEVNGITFRADKGIVKQINRDCDLERGGESRLMTSKYSPEERLERAHRFLAKNGFMHVDDYARLTGLSYSTASRELRRLAGEPSSGITSSGSKSGKVYLGKKA